MRKLFLLSLLFFAFNAVAQDGPLSFSGVVHVADSASKDELYRRALNWYQSVFRDANAVLQIRDPEGGQLSGKGNYQFQSRNFFGSEAVKGVVRYNVLVSVKDGRYRYEITDFIHEASPFNKAPVSAGLLTNEKSYPNKIPFGGSHRWYNKLWTELKEKSELQAKLLIASLKKAMEETSAAQSDW